MCFFQVIRDKKTKKSKGFGIISLLDGGDFAKVRIMPRAWHCRLASAATAIAAAMVESVH